MHMQSHACLNINETADPQPQLLIRSSSIYWLLTIALMSVQYDIF